MRKRRHRPSNWELSPAVPVERVDDEKIPQAERQWVAP